jgi:arabinofuranan 3-O-arabinosyltransferase
LLRRSGIKYIVVQNDVQWQLSDSPSPFQVHQVLESSGLKPVAKFGPTIETLATDIPTLSSRGMGLRIPYSSVEVFRTPHDGASTSINSPVATYPASSAVLVSGGPEAVKQLLDNGVINNNEAAVLAGDWDGSYHGKLFTVTDTLRRQSVKFGLVNDNSSYTYTATGQTPAQARIPNVPADPSQLLPFSGVQHQTVAVLNGAKSISVSSAGSVFFNLPEYDPANVFDGESSSGWVTGSPFGAVGEWIQINFDHQVDPTGTHIQFIVGPGHPQVTGVRVSTDRGSVLTNLTSTSGAQLVNVPAGTARYLRVTFTSLKGPGANSEPAGIRTISIPGVHVQLLLKPPQESAGKSAQHLALSFQATPVDYNDLLRSAAEPVIERQFSTPKPMNMTVTGQAQPQPGTALDALIGSTKLSIGASSSFGNLPQYRPQNLIDGSKKTSWVASSPNASIQMQWPHPAQLSSLKVVESELGFVTRPTEILISSPAGSRLLHVGSSPSETLTFAPLKTDRITVSFPKVQTRRQINGLGMAIQAPVALAELDFPKLAFFTTRAPNPSARISTTCGSGPSVTVDGKTYETALAQIGNGPRPTVGSLMNLQPIGFAICEPYEALSLSGGTHQLVTDPGPFTVSALTFKEVGIPNATPSARQTRVLSWGQESRTVAITSGAATYLEVHQNYNSGWTASLNGQTLTPIRLDGWQQGYLVPAGRGGTVQLSFTPETPYLFGLGIGALGVVVLLLLAFGVLGRRRGENLEPANPWNAKVPLWLSIGLAAVVLFVAGGPVVLAVPVLVLVGIRRPAWLPWVAFAAMTAAGVIAAVHPGSGALTHSGAFSDSAQVCALVALAAVLVPVIGRGSTPPETRVVADGDRFDRLPINSENGHKDRSLV